jgi:hypothetical protein
VTFFSGLEHKYHATLEVILAGNKQSGRVGQHGRMGVVAAGVHGPFHNTLERLGGVFWHREGIHVTAEQNSWSRPAGLEYGDDTTEGLTGGDREAQPLKRFEDLGLSAREIVTELGVLVQVTPHCNRAGEKLLGIGQ